MIPRSPWFNGPVRVVAVVLAAGAGRRIGGPKALLPIGGTTFLAHVARGLLRPGVAAVVAVVGHGARRIKGEAGVPADVALVDNPRPDDGMLGSVLLGLDAAEARGADAVLLHPVDHPFTSPATTDAVLAALASGAVIAVPSYGGRRGHPGGFARAAWTPLRRAPPERGARVVLAEHPEWLVHVPGDEGCVTGIDTAGDYERHVGRYRRLDASSRPTRRPSRRTTGA
jgi:CTP:molybdopterin cytidylyltransferase MocA